MVRVPLKAATGAVCIAAVAFALAGCQSFREAAGVAKLPPDEFTVLTKAPLVIPPDYNLRPPQPGAPERSLGDPTQQARNALFAQDPATAAAQLGNDYSAGEKQFLAKSGASVADPSIRQAISSDSGLADKGDDFARGVLYPQGTPAAAPAGGTAD
jgi:hypothetical protein